MNSIVRLLLVIAGSISLAFGVIGIFLPVLPTTPFLLLASFCYVRSSERLHRWLLEHRVFGKYIYNYEVHRAIPKKTKIIAMVTLWPTLLFSLTLIPLVPVRVGVFIVGLIVSWHLLSMRTLNHIDDGETPDMSPRKDVTETGRV